MLRFYHLLLLLCHIPVGSIAQIANRFDIVIDELMADPSPVTGLPNSEFIELKNNSSVPLSLRNWKLGDGTGSATINSNFVLQPDSFVIICPNAAVAEFSTLGATIGVSNFPSLNNDHDIIILYSPEGRIIHAIEFSNTWYKNDVKREGGWSLEMIDTRNPCNGSNNWKASIDQSGGTPGRKNLADDINVDEISPSLLKTYTIDTNTIVAVFDEPLDSIRAATVTNYTILEHPITAIPVPPLYNEVILKFASPLAKNTIYQLSIYGISDCTGNVIGTFNSAPVGLPEAAANFDLVFNEILFNPAPAGYDFIEIYNRSNKVVDLQNLYICNLTAAGNLINIRSLSDKPTLFFPDTYIVITENASWLRSNYIVKDEGAIIELPALPSMPDEQEHIAIVNNQGERIDALQYDQKWHFALIDNEEGISLERINYNDSTQRKSNWTSAASTAGFGTPGYQNSQFRADLIPQGTVTVSPRIFSPDNSGMDDFASIRCQFTEPGYVINITIFDQHGRAVRHLIRNSTMGISAVFNWDGLDDQQKKLPIGHYIILTGIFNLQGKTKRFKNVITLARRL